MEDFVSQNEFMYQENTMQMVRDNKTKAIISQSQSKDRLTETLVYAFNHKALFPHATVLECLQVAENNLDL
jgi:ABC-type histidine transport system ATPase subunit